MRDSPTWPGELRLPSSLSSPKLTNRSPDGQTLILSSADGYCSIVVFDLSELGTISPTQQHQRQLQAIAHAHAAHAIAPPSSVSMRSSPAPPTRSEREGSASSSVVALPTAPILSPAPSVHSSAEFKRPSMPTPDEEVVGLGLGGDAGLKRAAPEEVTEDDADPGAKKKRRVALTHLGTDEA